MSLRISVRQRSSRELAWLGTRCGHNGPRASFQRLGPWRRFVRIMSRAREIMLQEPGRLLAKYRGCGALRQCSAGGVHIHLQERSLYGRSRE
jgi:hypothetical protein